MDKVTVCFTEPDFLLTSTVILNSRDKKPLNGKLIN